MSQPSTPNPKPLFLHLSPGIEAPLRNPGKSRGAPSTKKPQQPKTASASKFGDKGGGTITLDDTSDEDNEPVAPREKTAPRSSSKKKATYKESDSGRP